MKDHNKQTKHGIGLQFALNGLKEAFLQEKNFRIHIIATFLVLLVSFYLRLTAFEWLFVLFVIQLVFITELVNSVIERLIDYIKPELHPKAKIIKDMAAAIVLISVIFSVVTGLIIFLPKIIKLLQF